MAARDATAAHAQRAARVALLLQQIPADRRRLQESKRRHRRQSRWLFLRSRQRGHHDGRRRRAAGTEPLSPACGALRAASASRTCPPPSAERVLLARKKTSGRAAPASHQPATDQ